MRINLKGFLIALGIVCAISLGLGGYAGYEIGYTPPVKKVPAMALGESALESCHTPGEDCTQFVVDRIALAEKQVLVQAYGFTNDAILEAIGRAKSDKKLDVRVILDKSNERCYEKCKLQMKQHNVPLLTDYRPAIAHNKVIIIDGKHVLTGSFNFTESAQRRNAENVVFVANNPKFAARFIEKWNERAAASREFELKERGQK